MSKRAFRCVDGRRGAVEVGYRAQDPSPVTERGDPHLPEVVVRKLAKDGEVNVVGNKTLGMLRQADRSEPSSDLVHGTPTFPHPSSPLVQ